MTQTTTTLPPGPGTSGPGTSPAGRVLLDPSAAAMRALHTLEHVLHAALPVLAVTAAVVAVAAVALRVWLRLRRARATRGGRVVTILAPPEVDPSGGEALWRNLHDLLRPRWQARLTGQPHLSFEYSWSAEGARIAIWAPQCVPPGMVERAVEAAWPAARTHTASGTAPSPGDTPAVSPLIPESATVAGGRLVLASGEWFSLRTDFDADPLRAVMGAAAPHSDSETAVVQVLARPAGGRAAARLRRAARHLRAGRPANPLARVLDVVGPGPRRPVSTDPAAATDARAVLAKASEPLWSVTIRYAVTNTGKSDLRVLRGRAHALASAFALYSGRNRFARRRLRRPARTLQARQLGRGDLLSTAELAGLAHLPLDRVVPSLTRAGARPVPPPASVGRDPRAGKLLGMADAGGVRPVVLAPADARHHLHVMGATGSGKSTLLSRLILADIAAGRGAVVIDPKGDLITDIRQHLGPHQAARLAAKKKLVLVDPADPDGRPRLNMLEVPRGVEPDIVVDHLVGIFGRIFERHWGPRLEDILRSTCLTLLQRRGPTLADVPRLLARPGDHAAYLEAGAHEELRGFWKWYEALGDAQRAQVVGPLLYKLRAFLLRPTVREIVAAPASTLHVGDLLDGGLLLVRVPKGTLGEDTARLLGSFVVAKVWQAATARAALGQDARVDASLYVDECQNFLTLPRSFDEILAEARGYRLSLVLAHQHLGQLPRELRDAVSANARNKVLFTMSPEDAYVLARHTTPALTEHDLANLDAYQAAARLVVAGQDTPAFTLRALPLDPPNPT